MPEAVWVRARGGSKSRDLVLLALYLAYRGFKALYFCPTADQCRQPSEYLGDLVEGCFLKRLVRVPSSQHLLKRSVTFRHGGRAVIKNLTAATSRSGRADALIFDEERHADPELLRDAASILNTSPLALTVHASTPAKGTAFEDSYRECRDLQARDAFPRLVFERAWEGIGFLSEGRTRRLIEHRRSEWPAWYFRMEYENEFTVPEGAVFRNVCYEVPPEKREQFDAAPTGLVSGLDWNPAAGHTLVALKSTVDGGESLVYAHEVLGTGYAVELESDFWRRVRPYCTGGNELVVEGGGNNEPFVTALNELASRSDARPDFSVEEWDSRGRNKMAAAVELRERRLYLDAGEFPALARQVQNAAWDIRPDGTPELAKDPSNSPHGLDALLHAASPSGGGGVEAGPMLEALDRAGM